MPPGSHKTRLTALNVLPSKMKFSCFLSSFYVGYSYEKIYNYGFLQIGSAYGFVLPNAFGS